MTTIDLSNHHDRYRIRHSGCWVTADGRPTDDRSQAALLTLPKCFQLARIKGLAEACFIAEEINYALD